MRNFYLWLESQIIFFKTMDILNYILMRSANKQTTEKKKQKNKVLQNKKFSSQKIQE